MKTRKHFCITFMRTANMIPLGMDQCFLWSLGQNISDILNTLNSF